MATNSSITYHDGFRIGDIVWARRNQDGMYWPGRITYISNQISDTVSNQSNFQDQSWSYLVEFFGYNQNDWTAHVLPYQHYRDYMSKHLSAYYDSYPQIKYRLLNGINQADYANMNGNCYMIKEDPSVSTYSFPSNNSNYNYISTSNSLNHTTCENFMSNNYPVDSYYQYPSHHFGNCQSYLHNYCSYCTQNSYQSTEQLTVETNGNFVSKQNNDYSQQDPSSLSSEILSNDIKNGSIIEPINQPIQFSSVKTDGNFPTQCLTISPITKRRKKLNQQNGFENFRKKLLKRKLQQNLSHNDRIPIISPEHYVENILQNSDVSK